MKERPAKRPKKRALQGSPKVANPANKDKNVPVLSGTSSPLAKVSRGERRKHLDDRLRSLYQRVIYIERQLSALEGDRFFRCCIFGSARIKPDTKAYNEVFTLARLLAWEGIDILTGGGPGLMEAANKGAKLGQQEKQSKTLSFGISIQLEFEPVPNSHLDVKRHHQRFSSRLDDFMRLSNCIVCTPGGIGTLLELFFAWQLIQVKHMEPRPIILLDKEYWSGIISWMKSMPNQRGLMSLKDFDCLHIVDTPEEAFEIVSATHQNFMQRKPAAAAK
ncbi:MAG: LOG family protein [Proteobacteria bacterium]|nr:LOG family protein [Pseudomonadota bacterium]